MAKLQTMDLVEFIHASHDCCSSQELTDKFLAYLSRYGLDRFVMSDMAHDSTVQKENHHGLLVNYPDEWMKYYVENHYIDHDPVYQTALRSPRPFTWEEVQNRQNVTRTGMRVMREARECRLYDGIGLSIHLPLGQVIGMGFAASERGVSLDRRTLSEIYAAAHQFFVAFQDISGINSLDGQKHELTKREREVLLWLSRGKTKGDIADICCMSESGVKRHCERIFAKLNVLNTAQAVAQALRMGLINPF